MSAPKEVEVKFLVTDAAALERSLRRNGFRQVTPPTYEHNTLYDLAGNPLRRRGEILRLRQYGEAWMLTHKSKGSVGRHKTREELETVVSDGVQMDAVLRALGYQPTFIYEKFRAEWTDGKGHVVVDGTPLGIVAEIEGSPRWIDATAKCLNVSPKDYITLSYGAMFLEWKKKTGSPAENMTFRECKFREPAASKSRK